MNRQGIEGVPDHLKAVKFRHVQPKERYLADYEVAYWTCSVPTTCQYLIVQPDNVYNVYDLAEVKIPAGYEFVRFDTIKKGDEIINCFGVVEKVPYGLVHTMADDYRRIIVKPIAKKTRRVLVVDDTELPEQFHLENVVGVEWRTSQVDLNLKWRIEEREVA